MSLTVRPLVALLACVAMLHLALVREGSACAAPAASGAGRAHQMAASPVHHAAIATISAPAECAAPCPWGCCDAMSGCGVTAVVAVATRPALETAPRAAPRPAPRAQLVSFTASPEPPPPK